MPDAAITRQEFRSAILDGIDEAQAVHLGAFTHEQLNALHDLADTATRIAISEFRCGGCECPLVAAKIITPADLISPPMWAFIHAFDRTFIKADSRTARIID
jgi:hypothetical protein